MEAKGQPWVYSLKDKTETKVNHQNFAPKHVLVVEACFKRSGYCQFLSARGLSCLMCDPSQVRSLGESGAPALANGFSWAWRFTFDSVHGKLTARKPYLVVDADLKLEKGKAIRVTKTQGWEWNEWLSRFTVGLKPQDLSWRFIDQHSNCHTSSCLSLNQSCSHFWTWLFIPGWWAETMRFWPYRLCLRLFRAITSWTCGHWSYKVAVMMVNKSKLNGK